MATAMVLVSIHAHAQGALFKSGVDMVALTVTVTDSAGQAVSGLTADHFAVFEDGVQQTLSLFGSEQVPVDVAFVLDTSSSMSVDLPLVKQAARGLVSRLRAADRAAVFEVSETVGNSRPFTDDHDQVIAAVEGLKARGSTALYDGLYTSLREFQRERRLHPELRRHALVLLSDGLDNASHVTFDDAAELARQLDVTIYTIALQQQVLSLLSPEQRQANYAMRALARETGGQAFFPAKAVELEMIYASIARELVSQYALGYVASTPGDRGAFKRVSVRLLPPAEGRARTRSGYLARTSTSAAPRGLSSSNFGQPH
jgi:Ca-activated chloride channel family protein